jgi:hypothetical protein
MNKLVIDLDAALTFDPGNSPFVSNVLYNETGIIEVKQSLGELLEFKLGISTNAKGAAFVDLKKSDDADYVSGRGSLSIVGGLVMRLTPAAASTDNSTSVSFKKVDIAPAEFATGKVDYTLAGHAGNNDMFIYQLLLSGGTNPRVIYQSAITGGGKANVAAAFTVVAE